MSISAKKAPSGAFLHVPTARHLALMQFGLKALRQ